MLFSLSEEIVSEYFERKGFVILRNVVYPVMEPETGRIKPGNQEIDIIAYKDDGVKEIHFISCKRGALDKDGVKKEIHVLKTATDFMRSEQKYSWLMKDETDVFYHYIAEIVRNEQEWFDELAPALCVKVNNLSEVLEDYIRLLANEMGPGLKDGNESSMLPRLIKYLIQHQNVTHNRRSGKVFTDLEHVNFERIRSNLKGKEDDLKEWLEEKSSIL